jgi:uncharacterized protein
MRVVQLSDIHLDEYTEPYFLRHVWLTESTVCSPMRFFSPATLSATCSATKSFAIGAAWQCAQILSGIQCRKVYAILGNHDVAVGRECK